MSSLLVLVVVGFLAAAPERATLSGVVQNEAGQPVADVSIIIRTAKPRKGVGELCVYCYPDCTKRALSDSQGKFELKDLDPALVFHLLAVREGYAPLLLEEAFDPQKGAAKLTLKPHDLERRDPGLVLRGRVTNENSEPIAGATVEPCGVRLTESSGIMGNMVKFADPLAITNDRGEFGLGVKNKEHPVYLVVKAPFLSTLYADPLSPGPTVHVMKLVGGGSVAGTVVKAGKPVPGITLVLADKPPPVHGAIRETLKIATDARGCFHFDHVPPDRDYGIFATMESSQEHGALPAQLLHVGASGSQRELDNLEMQSGHRLSGRIVLSDGKPLPAEAKVFLNLHYSNIRLSDSLVVAPAEDGGFAFHGLPDIKPAQPQNAPPARGVRPSPNYYSVRVRVPGYHLSEKNRSYESRQKALVGIVDRDLEHVRIVLEPGSPVTAAAPGEPRTPSQIEMQQIDRLYNSRLEGVPPN